MNAKKLTKLAMLTTLALIIFAVEAQIPIPIPIPGVKLGLANVITVYAAFTMKPRDAILILLCRIVLGSMFSGNVMSLMYSLGGGILCIAVTLLMAKLLSQNQIWIASVMGAIFHNVGQIIVAVFVMGSIAVIAYLPYLLISAVITGTLTGLTAQAVTKHMKKISKDIE